MLTADSFQLAAFSRVSVGKPQPRRIVHVDITHYDAAYSMPRIHTEFGVKTEYIFFVYEVTAHTNTRD